MIMEKIALTGGIGTGKTFISKQFIQQGIPVFYADDEAKKLYDSPQFLTLLRKSFGDAIFDGEVLNARKLSSIVFDDKNALKKLEAIIHPLVMDAFEVWARAQGTDKVMMESAIIFEAHLAHYFDKVIVVNASLPVRIRRIKQRNPEMSETEILARINAQMSQEEKCRLADEVIEHDIDL